MVVVAIVAKVSAPIDLTGAVKKESGILISRNGGISYQVYSATGMPEA